MSCASHMHKMSCVCHMHIICNVLCKSYVCHMFMYMCKSHALSHACHMSRHMQRKPYLLQGNGVWSSGDEFQGPRFPSFQFIHETRQLQTPKQVRTKHSTGLHSNSLIPRPPSSPDLPSLIMGGAKLCPV